MSELEIKLANIIKDNTNYGGSIEEINDDTSLWDIGINSLTYIKILVVIEDEFNIEFGDDFLDVKEINTFKDLVIAIKSIL